MIAAMADDMPGRAIQPSVVIAAAIGVADIAAADSPDLESPYLPPGYQGGAGDETIGGGDDADRIHGNGGHDVLYGNGGNDTLSGGDGNDHIYGFGLSGDPSGDGADSLYGGAGTDYIQGNAGDDIIYGGEGGDRLNGGAGNDTVAGESGNDSINGNKGGDYVSGDAGSDTVRGGQGADTIIGGEGNDQLWGDLGDDLIAGGSGQDTLTGGQGFDIFLFIRGEAEFVRVADNYVVDVISDFEDGIDKLRFNNYPLGAGQGDILRDLTHSDFRTVDAAFARAQQLLDNHVGGLDVAILGIGGDSYLFYNDDQYSPINSIIRIVGVTPDKITSADFTI